MQRYRTEFRIFSWMLKILIYIAFFNASLSLYAQSIFQLTIEKNDSTSPNLIEQSLIESVNGDIYVVGTTYPGGWYAKNRIIKMNNQGYVMWDTTYSHTPSEEYYPEIMPTDDGGIILACMSFSYPLNDEDSESDILIWKINALGVIEWQEILSARSFIDMNVSKDGGYLLLGGASEHAIGNGLDMIAYKIDKNGNVLWQTRMGQNTSGYPYEREWGQSIKEIDDQIYVCGYHSHDGWLELDGVMYVLDEFGNELWDIFMASTPEYDKIRINSVFKFKGRYYFNGRQSLFEFNPQSGEYLETPDSLVIMHSGKGYNFEVLCGGEDQDIVVTNYVNGTHYLRRYNNLIQPYYEKIIPVVYGTQVECHVTHDGGVILLTTGASQSIHVTKMDCLGNVDHWSDECNSKIPIGEQLLIYPNPSESEIRIDATFDFNEVAIYSPNGQHISFVNPCSCPRQTLDISDLVAGVYIVRISSDENYAISRFVKY